jgi:hypothetical protein
MFHNYSHPRQPPTFSFRGHGACATPSHPGNKLKLITIQVNNTNTTVDVYIEQDIVLSSVSKVTCNNILVQITGIPSGSSSSATMSIVAPDAQTARRAVQSFTSSCEYISSVNGFSSGRTDDHIRLFKQMQAMKTNVDKYIKPCDRSRFKNNYEPKADPSPNHWNATPTTADVYTYSTYGGSGGGGGGGGNPIDTPFLPSENRAVTIEFIEWFFNSVDLGHMRAAAHERAEEAAIAAATAASKGDSTATALQDNALRQRQYAQVYEKNQLNIATVNMCYDKIVPETKLLWKL